MTQALTLVRKKYSERFGASRPPYPSYKVGFRPQNRKSRKLQNPHLFSSDAIVWSHCKAADFIMGLQRTFFSAKRAAKHQNRSWNFREPSNQSWPLARISSSYQTERNSKSCSISVNFDSTYLHGYLVLDGLLRLFEYVRWQSFQFLPFLKLYNHFTSDFAWETNKGFCNFWKFLDNFRKDQNGRSDGLGHENQYNIA